MCRGKGMRLKCNRKRILWQKLGLVVLKYPCYHDVLKHGQCRSELQIGIARISDSENAHSS